MYLHTAIRHLLFVLCISESSDPAVLLTPDVPVSYNHRPLHNYSIYKTKYDNVRPLLNLEYTTPLIFKGIQYAPLIIKRKENNVYSEKKITNQNKTYSMTKKENTKNHTRQLEPREHSDKSLDSTTSPPVPIISGYNIDFSTLNEVKYDRKNLLRELNNYNHVTKPKKSPVVNLNIDMKESLRSKTLYNMNEKNVLQDGKTMKSVQALLAMENAQIQPALVYGKMPYLHLNVARSFNVARTPYKAQKNEYVLKNSQRTLLERSSLFYSMPNVKYNFA